MFVVAVTLVAIPFSYLVVQVTSHDGIITMDKAAAGSPFELKQPAPTLTKVLTGISMLGAPTLFWVLIGAVSIHLWLRHRRRLVAFLLTSTLGGSIVNTAVKIIINRPRPTYLDPSAITHQDGRSFPSGHTMSATIAYGALLLIFLPLMRRRYRRWAVGGVLVLVTLIAMSRVGLGVHYISDVVGGFILGLAWLAASAAAFNIWSIERGRLPKNPTSGAEAEVKTPLRPT